MKTNSQQEHDPRRASRGWPVTDHVGETRLTDLLVVMDEQALMADDPMRTPLLTRAAMTAAALDCDVTLYASCDESVTPRLSDRLADLASQLASAGIDVSIRALPEPLDPDVLLCRIEDLAPDLVMKRNGSPRFLIGLMSHMDWKLLRHSPIPVWFVTDRGDKSSIRRVLTALGASEHPEDVTDAHDYDLCALANLISDATSAQNSILHTCTEEQPRHHQVIDAFARYFHIDRECVLLHTGPLSDAVAEAAGKLTPDLIVMGARNLTKLQRLLHPVHAEPILAGAPCDVLVLPHSPAGLREESDSEAAALNPAAYFRTPEALTGNPSLSLARKLELLDIWEGDVRAEMVEEEEGGPVGPSRADRLQRIHRARQSLAAVTQPEFS